MLIRRLEAVVPQVLFRVLAQTGVLVEPGLLGCDAMSLGVGTLQPITIKTIHSFETSGKTNPATRLPHSTIIDS